jgi:hypothetical protein
VKTEVAYGGFVWVNTDDRCEPLKDYIGSAMEELDPFINLPLEVFHYHRAVVNTNFKLWHDTNSEFYHDYMHYFNRVTGMMQPGYFDRACKGYDNGHVLVGSMEIKYDAYDGAKKRGVGWPGLGPGAWILVDLFPGLTYNLRTSVLRMDTMIPLGPNKVMIEYRGLGLKSDTPEERRERVFDHNTIWGPFGRNLHEDLLGVHGQGRALREGADARWILIDLFPGLTYNLRTSVLRMDTMIPLGPNKVMIEYRGLGLKSDTAEERRERIFDHNTIWGPFGRNLHEDLLGVHGQGRALRQGTDARWVLHGREENSTIHDEVGMRHYYAEWSKRMGRKAFDPFSERREQRVSAAA